MKIEFTGRQTEIPDELRRLAERKLAKLGKLLPSVTRAHVILAVDKHRQVAEVSVHSRHLDLAAVEVSADPRLSVAGAIDKLTRQAQRQQAKTARAEGRFRPRGASAAPAAEADGGAVGAARGPLPAAARSSR